MTTDEEIQKLIETAGYYRTYCTFLKKDLEEKNTEIGKLNSYIQELINERSRVKGDLKAYRKDIYITDLLKRIKELKADNEKLIIKIGNQYGTER